MIDYDKTFLNVPPFKPYLSLGFMRVNIGTYSTPYVALHTESRQTELSSVGRDSIAPNFLSTRPVPSIDASSGSNSSALASDIENFDNPNTTPSEAGQESDAAATNSAKDKVEQNKLKQEQAEITQLAARDREVRSHEQAHAAVGGQYAGAPRYELERGPDGVSYAVGGEVSIDVSPAATPQETILKMQIVRRAALAPSEPSPQDRSVAAKATQYEADARSALRSEGAEESTATSADDESTAAANTSGDTQPKSSISQQASGLSTPSASNDATNVIRSRLNTSILATSLTSRTGNVLDHLA